MKNFLKIFLCLVLGAPLTYSQATAQNVPSALSEGIRQEERLLDQRVYERRLKREKAAEEQKKEEAEVAAAAATGPKTLIQSIDIDGNTLLEPETIDEFLAEGNYIGQELTFRQMQNIANKLTAIYRAEGFVTSRAYIPPQPLNDGNLQIKVLEGTLGQYDIFGNKHFSTELLESKFDVRPGEPFDYTKLQSGLEAVNEHPDRDAQMVLSPGATTGSTNVTLEVEDRWPVHIGFEYDNFASRFLEKDRFAVVLEHNNVTGRDDRISFKTLGTDSRKLRIHQLRYIRPFGDSWQFGGHWLYSRSKLGGDLSALEAIGDAEVYGIFLQKQLLNIAALEVRSNFGFDYKDIRNKQLGAVTSHDRLSVFKAGLDFDLEDTFGRSIMTVEWHRGIADFLGASSSNNALASRAGAGGDFDKFTANFFRLQPLPLETHILWKNLAQYTNDNLPASEQFLLGGATSVRGYAPGDAFGDSGFYSALEWSVPLYGLNRDIDVPFYEGNSLYDKFRLVFFYDYGSVNLNNPQVGEESEETLKGYGLGARLNLPGQLDARVEVGWPEGRDPSDNREPHTWLEFDVFF